METITIDHNPLKIEDVWNIAQKLNKIKLSSDPEFVERVKKGSLLVKRLLKQGEIIYGVNTGVGENCGALVAPRNVQQFG